MYEFPKTLEKIPDELEKGIEFIWNDLQNTNQKITQEQLLTRSGFEKALQETVKKLPQYQTIKKLSFKLCE